MKIYLYLSVFVLAGAMLPVEVSAQSSPIIENLKGKVVAIRRFKREPLSNGYVLKKKDIVVASPDSSAVIRLPNGTIIEVGSNSRIKMSKFLEANVTKGKDTEIELLTGTASFNVKKLKKNDNFQVKTPVAVAGVRGTKFLVVHMQSSGGAVRSSVAVLSGRVAVSSVKFNQTGVSRPVVVARMQSSSVSQDAPPTPPQPIPPRVMQRVLVQAGLTQTAAEEGAAPPPSQPGAGPGQPGAQPGQPGPGAGPGPGPGGEPGEGPGPGGIQPPPGGSFGDFGPAFGEGSFVVVQPRFNVKRLIQRNLDSITRKIVGDIIAKINEDILVIKNISRRSITRPIAPPQSP